MYKLKSNQEINEEFTKQENLDFMKLRKDIMETSKKLDKLQREHKRLTGKNMICL
jgi:hypothetical protein